MLNKMKWDSKNLAGDFLKVTNQIEMEPQLALLCHNSLFCATCYYYNHMPEGLFSYSEDKKTYVSFTSTYCHLFLSTDCLTQRDTYIAWTWNERLCGQVCVVQSEAVMPTRPQCFCWTARVRITYCPVAAVGFPVSHSGNPDLGSWWRSPGLHFQYHFFSISASRLPKLTLTHCVWLSMWLLAP
jgi:hypothetical protein